MTPRARVRVAVNIRKIRKAWEQNRDGGHRPMAAVGLSRRYDHANEERYGGAIEALDEAGKTGSAEALAAARWNQR